MTIHIHLHTKDAGVFSRTSSQQFGKLATAARASASAEKQREAGNVYNVQKQQKNGKLAPADNFSQNLSKERAETRKGQLESMNPGSTYIVTS